MGDKRMTVMIEWDGLGDEDDEFFESRDRMSSAMAMHLLASSGSDEDEPYDDNRISFASAFSTPPEEFRSSFASATSMVLSGPMSGDYKMWISEPGSIEDRRKRLFQGMGLNSEKQFMSHNNTTTCNTHVDQSKQLGLAGDQKSSQVLALIKQDDHYPLNYSSNLTSSLDDDDKIVRSKSEGQIAANFADAKCRKEDFFATSVLQHFLSRSSSEPWSFSKLSRNFINKQSATTRLLEAGDVKDGHQVLPLLENGDAGPFFIKNLDTGKEFIIKDFSETGGFPNNLSDVQTGKMLTLEEFEKFVGHSPIVKELMRRESIAKCPEDGIEESDQRKNISSASQKKNLRSSKRKGVNWLKNIRGVANSINGFMGDKDKDDSMGTNQEPSVNPASKWTKVHQRGKSYKEFTGLYKCQEIQAHEGSIWCIRFSLDARYLATAGEDCIIHVWEVVDCDVSSSRPLDEANSMPVHPMAKSSPENPPLPDAQSVPSEKKKKGKNSSTNKSIPDYVSVPETVFSLTEKPVCSFEGHLDDVLDLSWSKSQQLLSSSMDKTVRLWDMENKTCLKLFAHKDYVTCIQFNPIDDNYFISGSLDAKVRIWSIPDGQVVDWTDLHEMVTALSYTPDGQGALVGSHKGSYRVYNISDFKLNQKDHIEVRKKKKSQAKKITGFQFAPGNPSEVLITSADSRIRIFDGSTAACKFTGFRNTNSQIPASFSADGKYVVSASEDSQVYIWKRRNSSGGKSKGLITKRSHEHFQCKDVSVAVPWPGTIKGEPPLLQVQPKRNSKRSSPLPPPAPATTSTSGENAAVAKNTGSKRNLPPLHPKTGFLERSVSCNAAEEELGSTVSFTDSSVDGSVTFSSASDSFSYGDPSAISASDKSSSSSLSLSFDSGNSNGNHSIQTTAWGLVIVAAGLGGELRVYQNFGLPVVSRQTSIFRDYGSPGSLTRYFHGT